MNILVIDDENALRRTIRAALESYGHRVLEATNRAQAIPHASSPLDLVLLDLRLGRESGLDLLAELLKLSPGLGVVVITAYASVDTAVEAMRRGALDYLPKPFTSQQLADVVGRWGGRLVAEADGAILDSAEPAMRQVLETAFTAAESDITVLLRGESGTGKGVLARAIHSRSRRAARPCITVHCPSLSAELLESELFGHVKGAFTGAIRSTDGKVAAAEGGTLFLDEVGDLPLPLQPKLLRLVQDRAYERVGEAQSRAADVRIVAATNRNLEAEATAGRFREDLLYRLNVFEVTVPSLRDRRLDLLPLAEHLLVQLCGRARKPIMSFTQDAREAILQHRWPGNVRELRNAIERGILLSRSTEFGIDDLPPSVKSPIAPPTPVAVGEEVPIDAVEVEHIRRVLAASSSLEEAARTLGIDPSTLYRKRKRYGL